MPTVRRALLAGLLVLAGTITLPVRAQMPPPPMGGPGDVPVNPPTSRSMADFIGAWRLTWQDPGNPDCPCRSSLFIDIDNNADGTSLAGRWKTKDGEATLNGTMSYQAKVWSGRFTLPDDGTGFPAKGHFRLESRDPNTLTGSYQREGTAIGFAWTATRE